MKSFVLGTLLSLTTVSYAATEIEMFLVNPKGEPQAAGKVIASDSEYGLIFQPLLQGLPRGVHGFHVHENPNCGNNALDAGGHYDPKQTGKHLGPYNNNGHLGDLPVLIVDDNGKATLAVLAPRLTEQDIKGRALMVHAGADNYSDEPKKLGGGGARIACGVVPK